VPTPSEAATDAFYTRGLKAPTITL
jgi:hypothetical protein